MPDTLRDPKPPAGTCDCHVHVFGDEDRYPIASDASYRPPFAPLEELASLHDAIGVERVVLVQPSVYGTDNRCLVDALGRLGDRGRGVAVVDPETTTAELRLLGDAGVRGIRLNVAASIGDRGPSWSDRLRRLGDVAATMGWHVQVFAGSRMLLGLADALTDLPVPVVIDHFGRGADGDDDALEDFLVSNLRSGAFHVKLSAAYLVSRRDDLGDVAALASSFARANPDRLLWGSNWPHLVGGTGEARLGRAGRRDIDDGAGLSAVTAMLGTGDLVRRCLVANPARLYGFPAPG